MSNYRARWLAPSRAICHPEKTVAPGPVQIPTWELQPAIPPPTAMINQHQLDLPACCLTENVTETFGILDPHQPAPVPAFRPTPV